MSIGLSPERGPEGKPPFIFPANVSMLEAALIYARYGWPVFPVQPQNKRPYPNTHGFYDANLDLKRIERWWRRNPDSMIATATGAFSGIFAVDLDRKSGGADGVATWTQLTAQHGGMPLTLSSTTPSTGQHHIFRHRDGLRGVKLDAIAPGIEIKADGGYIVLPPSLYTATNGGAGISYRWNTPLLPVAEPPEWLVAEIKRHNERGPQTGNQEPPANDPSVPYERVKAALSVIDPDIDRKSWLSIGCALFTQLGSEGFELWDGWSREGKKYNKHEMGRQWDSIVKGNYPYTIGTLFYHANHAQPDWREEEPNQPGHVEDGGQDERQEWPEIDDAAYHGFAGEVVRTIEPHSEADPVALLLQLLTCFGNIIGRTRYVQTESNRQHPNLFAALVGSTSKTRKGTSFGRVQAVVEVVDPVWTMERVHGGLSSGEGLINIVRDPIMKWDKETKKYVEADHGIDDKRLLVVEPEFAGVLAVMERSGNTISQLLRKAWDGGKLQTMTRKDPLAATNAHVSVIGHITLDELRARLTHTEMANGFANRFLFALVKRSQLLPHGGNLTDDEISRLGVELKDIVDVVRGDPLSGVVRPPRLTMTERAKEQWGYLYHDLAVEHPGLLGAITARAETQILRLALIYALLDRSDQIDLPHIEAGRAVWSYCDASAAHIFGDTLGDDVADSILAALKNAGQSGMSRTMIRDLFNKHQSKTRIDIALGLLAKNGRVRFELRDNGRGRKPTEMWFAR